VSTGLPELPNLDPEHFRWPSNDNFSGAARSTHPPRILLLYGSLRERSCSKLLTLEAARPAVLSHWRRAHATH
jgi:arsenic resistance protein ArsH